MKYLKIVLIAIISAFAFATADAQVIVKARIGHPVRRHRVVHRRVVVHHPVHHRPYRHR